MAVIKYKPQALFHGTSKSVESPLFYIQPGEVLQAQAFGFACSKAKLDSQERTVPQVAYLEQVMLDEALVDSTENKNKCCCTKLYDRATKIIATEQVTICGHCVMLSAKHNQLLLDLPGVYRFVLNDVTALTNVQIFLRTFTKQEFDRNSSLFIGERL